MAKGAYRKQKKPSNSIITNKARFSFNDIKAAQMEYEKRQDYLSTKIDEEFIRTSDDFRLTSTRGSQREKKVKMMLDEDKYDLKVYNGNKLKSSPRATQREGTLCGGHGHAGAHEHVEVSTILSNSSREPRLNQSQPPVRSPVQSYKLHFNEEAVRNYKEFRSDKQGPSRNGTARANSNSLIANQTYSPRGNMHMT